MVDRRKPAPEAQDISMYFQSLRSVNVFLENLQQKMAPLADGPKNVFEKPGLVLATYELQGRFEKKAPAIDLV